MEIYTTKFRGNEVNVIFTGSHYYFISSYYGVLAVAERDYNATEFGWDKEKKTAFKVTTGNHHVEGGSLGGSVVSSLVKGFIRKADQKHSPVKIEFTDEVADLANGVINMEYIQR